MCAGVDRFPHCWAHVHAVCLCHFIFCFVFQKDISVYETGQKQPIHCVPLYFRLCFQRALAWAQKDAELEEMLLKLTKEQKERAPQVVSIFKPLSEEF